VNAASFFRRIGAEVAAIAVLVIAVVVPVWPGIFTIDSQAMYLMAHVGRVDDWYSPIIVSCWRLLDWIGLPPSTVFVGTTVVVIIALLAIYRLALPRVWSIIATAATVLFPPVYGLLGWVGRDVWFLALVLVVIAALGWASVLPACRAPLVVLAFVAAWFAADARQNGFPVLAVVGGVAAWLLVSSRRHRILLVVGASLLAVVLGLATQRAARVVAVQRDVAPEQVLYYQDLLAVSLRLDESQVPVELLPGGRLDAVRKLWIPAQVGAVLFRDDPPVDYRPYHNPGHRTQLLRDAWIDMITSHPVSYVAERADLYRRLLGVGDVPPGAWYAETDPLPNDYSVGLQQRYPSINEIRNDYMELFESGVPGYGGPLHRAWIYVLLGLGGAAAIVAAGPRLRVFGWMLLALQLSLQLVLMLSATLLEYRFELFQVVLGIAAAVIGTRLWYVATRAEEVMPAAAGRGDSSAAARRRTDPTASSRP
jgi:hypothetical protein